MFHLIGQFAIGLVCGILAKLLMPGRDPGGFFITGLLGIAGAWVGARLGMSLGWYKAGQKASFGMAILGAWLLLLAYRWLS